MKKLTCNQLGGACDQVFTAATFEELQEEVKKHGAEMFAKQDAAHVTAIQEMMSMMMNPEAMSKWMEEKKALFEAAPDV